MQSMLNQDSSGKADLSRGFILDGWEVLPLAGSLARGAQMLHLEPKVMDVLLCLARHQGEVVSRDRLLEEVWGKVVVTDDAINRCISEVRTVLGDTGRQQSVIRTIPRRGYSLIVPVQALYAAAPDTVAGGGPANVPEVNPDTASSTTGQGPRHIFSTGNPGLRKTALVIIAPLLIMLIANRVGGMKENGADDYPAAGQPAIQADAAQALNSKREMPLKPLDSITSVAVLPFVNLSGDPDHEYFSDGLSEDIRNALLSLTSLRVAARTSSSVFKNKPMDVRNIAAQLNVDALLEGTVRIDAEHLRITVQLTDARNGYSIWASSYERSIADKIKMQTEIADEIAQQLAPSLKNPATLLKGVTANVRAHDYYLLGRHHWHQRSAKSLQLAEEYFKNALLLDPNYALAYSGLADALIFQTLYGNRSMADVREEIYGAIMKAMELEPDLAEAHASHGMLLEQTRQAEAARAAYRRAVELKPQYSMAHMWLGSSWTESRNVKQAHEHFQNALKVDPLHPQVQANFAQSLINQGLYGEALELLAEFLRGNPSEKFLKMQLEARLAMGQYDEVLNLAVGHTFTGEYKPYTNMAVIEALIQLQHIDKAKRMVRDNVRVMDDWQIAYARASIAVVDRDAEGLKQVAQSMLADDFEVEHAMLAACTTSFSTYLAALAHYIAGEYPQADAAFDAYQHKLAASECRLNEPELDIAALLYHAMSKLQIDREDRQAATILEQARSTLDELKALGWNTPTLVSIEVALLHLLHDDEQALARVRYMVERGWLPFGTMVSSPLFDSFLASDKVALELAEQSRQYERMRAQSSNIGLAKLGL